MTFETVYIKAYTTPYSEYDLDVQVDIQVNNPNCSSITSLKYSHRTDVSAIVDLDIWNWNSSTWFEIESVNNYATFDDDSFLSLIHI